MGREESRKGDGVRRTTRRLSVSAGLIKDTVSGTRIPAELRANGRHSWKSSRRMHVIPSQRMLLFHFDFYLGTVSLPLSYSPHLFLLFFCFGHGPVGRVVILPEPPERFVFIGSRIGGNHPLSDHGRRGTAACMNAEPLQFVGESPLS